MPLIRPAVKVHSEQANQGTDSKYEVNFNPESQVT